MNTSFPMSGFREQPFDFYGGGQEDLSEPENFFCLFLEQENFFAGPSGRIIFFLKPPEAHYIKPWGEGGTFKRAKYFLLVTRKVISKVYNVVFGVSETVYGVRKADFGLRKQISDCKRRIWSAKTGFGVRKRFLRQAGEFFFAGPLGRRIFFPCEVFLPPPPIKIKWLLP